MVDSRNIQLEVDPGYPLQLEFNPKETKLRIIDSFNSVQLYNKIQSFQHLGFIVEFDLVWTQKVPFDENQYEILKDVFTDRTSFYIYPNPSAEPALKFLVNWVSKFDFSSATGWMDGWGWFGEIKLVGAELLQKVNLPEWAFNQYD